jgi:hypothetical protein
MIVGAKIRPNRSFRSIVIVPSAGTATAASSLPGMAFKEAMVRLSVCWTWLTLAQTHPKFLHSNSTSHVWAFGAIAELIGTGANS